MVFGNGLESFGFNNFVAPTAAANPVFNANPDDVGMSFQVMQSRFGVVIGERYPARATLEVDFVHFDQSSPITAAYPRVRQVFFEWLPREEHRLVVGQTWDLFAPLNTPSFDLVANMYLAGNAGFMRPQAMYVRTTERFEYGAALGLQGPNNAAALTSVEYSVAPTVAARAGIRAGKQGSLVASGIGTRIRLGEPPAMRRWRWAYGGALSGERTLGPINFRAEGYAGTNLGNLGLLTLTQGSVEASVSELGGWASLKYTPSPHHTAHLVAGGARLIDDDDLRLGYTPAVGATRAQRVMHQRPGHLPERHHAAGLCVLPGLGRVVHRRAVRDVDGAQAGRQRPDAPGSKARGSATGWRRAEPSSSDLAGRRLVMETEASEVVRRLPWPLMVAKKHGGSGHEPAVSATARPHVRQFGETRRAVRDCALRGARPDRRGAALAPSGSRRDLRR